MNRAARSEVERRRKMLDKEYFKDWNYKKHAKLCAGVYLALFAFDMTISYPIVKKLLSRIED